ncbi:LLM class flavin-dependent oxidoreductase [Protaetiibacter mangrovi]|uniref:LLM class flavin-dependent oxidoreductase n=1 Tax=Protaetiibacter mangrovi TaxID=2970926 RepID=A0ABT1ZD20_9MICO|nr:LLM class flavin-dependent oxidoreductase [Protaetiibacter mangrovi]MCS0498589.1 LLM class flavin-dependent oxidoreductase [Protaetiibacter mangrovi]TPX04622.1 LLM class flavin-dependent oxidoreductase [Schumannella luteola]
MSTSVGVIFTPSREPEALRDFVVEAERLGLDEVLLFEDCFRESGIATAVAALAATSRIRVGIGVLPMPFRNVALLAMEVSTIERLFPGRLRLGVGHGVQSWMGQVGARPASPLTLMREYVPALRALLAGERLDVAGRYVTLDGVQLNWPPASPLPVWAAGEGPKTLVLTGEVADGTILTTGTPPEAVTAAAALVAQGRESVGRGGIQPLAAFVMTAFGDRADARLAAELAAWGYEGERAAGVAGSVTEVAEQLRPWVDAGASSLLLQPLDDETDLPRFLANCAEVAALVR